MVRTKTSQTKPNPELIFSNAVKNASNQITSNSPSRSEQKSQFDSSEDTNVTRIFFENIGNEEEKSPTVPFYGHGDYTKG